MKHIVAVPALALLIFNCGSRLRHYDFERHEYPVYINDDVGDMIDDVERQAYGLFPGVDGFVKAVLYEHRSGGYRWEMYTETERLFAFNKNPQAVRILVDYLERYEKGFGPTLEAKETWEVLTHDALGQPISLRDARSYESEWQQWCSACGCCVVNLGGLLPSVLTVRRMSIYSIDDQAGDAVWPMR